MSVIFNTGVSFSTGRDILSPLLVELENEFDKIAGLDDEYSKLGFVMYSPLTPDGKISSMVGPEPLREVGEDQEATILTIEQGYEKGYELKTYALQHKITKVMKKWIESNQGINEADSSVKNELNNLVDAMKYLVSGYMLTLNEIASKVYANGFSITSANGPGSAAGDGVALFGTHIIKKTGGTYSNVESGALSATTLASAILRFKTILRANNGRRIKTPNKFTLIVGRDLEQTARKIINSTSSQAGMFAGTGNNSSLLNEFNFEGSKVELVVSSMIGDIDVDGATIGSATQWFLVDIEGVKRAKGLRIMQLWDKEITIYENFATSSTFIKLDTHFTADHFDAHCYMVGSTGT